MSVLSSFQCSIVASFDDRLGSEMEARTAHQSKKKGYEFQEYIFKLVTEENCKIFNGMTESQEYLHVDEKCSEYTYVRPTEILERAHF